MIHSLVSLAVQAGPPAIAPASFTCLAAAFAALGLSTELRRRAASREESPDSGYSRRKLIRSGSFRRVLPNGRIRP